MKKTKKKLVLKKKTIAQLTDFTIGNKKANQVQGGKSRFCQTDNNICIVVSVRYSNCVLCEPVTV